MMMTFCSLHWLFKYSLIQLTCPLVAFQCLIIRIDLSLFTGLTFIHRWTQPIFRYLDNFTLTFLEAIYFILCIHSMLPMFFGWCQHFLFLIFQFLLLRVYFPHFLCHFSYYCYALTINNQESLVFLLKNRSLAPTFNISNLCN